MLYVFDIETRQFASAEATCKAQKEQRRVALIFEAVAEAVECLE